MNRQVGRFTHPVRDVKPLDQVPVLRDAKDGGRDRVDGHDVTIVIYSKSGNNVNVTNYDPLDELARPRENLHPWSFRAAVADNYLARLPDDRHFPWVPHLAFFLARVAKIILEQSILVKYLRGFGHINNITWPYHNYIIWLNSPGCDDCLYRPRQCLRRRPDRSRAAS